MVVQVEFRFEMGARVFVASHSADPGGIGFVTGREWKEDSRGARLFYRVAITEHEGQAKAIASGNRGDGFWYKDSLVAAT